MSDKKPLINFSDTESDSCEDEPVFHSQSHHTEYVASAESDSMELSALIGHECNSLQEHSIMDRAIGMVSECESGSRENVTYSESAYSNSQHRMGIEPEHNSKVHRIGIEPEHNSTEHRMDIEPACNSLEHRIGIEPEHNNKEHRIGTELEHNNKEHRMGTELEHNNKEHRMGTELEHNNKEHRIGTEPEHNNKEHRMGTELEQNSQELKMNAELKHNTPEHIIGSEPAHNSPEHKIGTSLVYNSTEHRIGTEPMHNSTEHKMSTEPMYNSTEHRLDSEWKSKSTENLICFEDAGISTEHRINTDSKHEIIQQRMNTKSEPQITEHKTDIKFVFKREKYGLSQESQPYTKDSEMPAEHDLDSTKHRVVLEDNNKKFVGTGQMYTNYDRDIDSVSFSTQHGFAQPDHGILPPSWSNDPHNSYGQVHGHEDESVICAEEQSHNLLHQSAFGNTQTSCEIQNVDISQRPNSSTAILDTLKSPQACKSFDVIENGQRLNPASLELIHAENQSATKSDADNVFSALSETMLSYDRSAPSESSSSFDQFDDKFMDNLLGKLDSPQPDSWLQEPKSSDAEMQEVPEDEKCPSVFIVSMMCEDHLLEEQLFQERNEPCMDRCLEEKVEDKDERERSFSSAENRVFQDAQKLDNDLMPGITNKEYQKVLEIYNLAPNNDNRAEANDFDHSSDLFREDSFSSFQQVQNIDYDVLPITEKESNGSYEMSELGGENAVLKPVSGPINQSETISDKFTATNMFGLDETSTDDQLNFFFKDDDATSAVEQDSDMSGLSDVSATYARNINQSLSEQLAVQGQESDEGLKKGEKTAEIYTSSNSSTASLTMNSHHPEKYFVEKIENYDYKPENCLNKIAENFELEENVCGDYSHKLKENSFAQHKDFKADTVSKSNHCGFVDKMQEKKSAENSIIMGDFSLIHLSDISSGEDNKEKTQNTTAFDDLSLFELPSEPQGKIYNEVSSEKSKERGDLLIDFSEEPQGETDMKENCKNTDTNPNCTMPTSRLNEAERISLNNSVAPKMIGFAEAFNKPEYESNVVTECAAIGSTTKSNTTEDDGDDSDDEDDDSDEEYRKSQKISAGGFVGDRQQQEQRTDISVEKRARTADTQGGKETSMHQQQKKESDMHHETDQEQKECSRTVRVHGLTADDEYLCKLYFENKKRSGGGVIEGDDITWDAESKCFILTFEDSAVARNVVSRKHSLKEKVIEVETWNPPLYYNDSVLLSGVPVGTTEDLIQNFLESIADINVASVQLDEPNGKALVALEHGPIDVAMLRQLCQENKLNDNVELSVHRVQVSDIVLVQNIKPETNTECIKFFFMNKMRNKGGPVNKVQRMDKTTAFVYFKNPEDAAAVVDKRSHILDGSPLQVTPHIVGFSFLNKSSTNEASPTAPACHETFVSRDNMNNPMTGSESLDVKQTDKDLKQAQHETHRPPGFTSPPPAQYYDQQRQNEYSKEDHTLNSKNFGLMKKGNCTFSVKFKGAKIAKQMNQSEILHDIHQNYSEYLSPSCEWQNLTDTRYTTCQKNSDRKDQKESYSSSKEQFLHENVCTTHRLQTESTYHKRNSRNFVPGHDEENSCQNERNSSQHHTVQRNFQGHYNTPTAAIKATHMFSIKKYIADEIMDDTLLKKDLVAVLKTVNCKYVWNKNHNGILVTCNEDVPPPGWIQEVEKVLDKFLLKISVTIGEGMIPVEQLQQSPTSHQVLKFPDRSLNRRHDQQVPQVAHINTASQQVSPVPGDKEKSSYQHELYEGSASSVSDQYTVGPENTPHTVCSSEDRLLQIPNKSPATSLPFSESSINLKPHQIKYLSHPKVMLKLKAQYPNVVISVDETASKLKVKAPEKFETKTKLDILSLITKVSQKSVPLTPAQIAMYGKKDTHDYVNKMLEVQEMICLWETTGSHFLVCALEDDHFRLSNYFSTFFKEEYFSVSEKQLSLLKTKEWDTLHTTLQQPGSDCPAPFINIDVQNKSIIIVGLPENVEKTKQLLQEFFFKMKTESKNISISTNQCKYLTHCNRERLKGMIDKARKAGVTLSLNNGVFVAEGPSNDVSRVHAFVKTVLISIDFQKKTFTGPGVAKYLLSPTGQDWLQHTGQAMHCLITTVSDQNAVSGSQVLASCLLGTQVQLDIVQGDITQYDVGAIVNAANNELSHGGGVAGAIVSAGGESIQEECTQIVKERGSIPDGSVVVSNPGTLQCSYILHAVGPVWKGGNKGEENVLMETIQNVLKEAEKMKLTTLAMPAISCGIFNYPPHSATLAILRTIKEHFEKGASESCLRSIVLIDTNADPLKAFISSAKQLFGKKVEVKAEPRETNAGFFKSIVSTAKQFFGTKDEGSAGPKETTHREHRWEGVGKSWAGSPKSHTKHNGNKKSGLPIRIIPGEIAKSRTDVIVCTVHPSLDLKKGVLSRNILDEGGARIQEELQKVFASRGPVQAGKVIKTSGGDLQCKNLFHLSLPSWKEDRGQVLKSAVHECLDLAQKVRAKSLAFPALGTGKLGYPSDEAAKIMFTTISKWFHENQDTCIQEVQIIVYSKDKDVLQAFKQAEQHGGRQHKCSNSDHTERRRTQADISGPLKTQVGKLRVIVKQGNILSESCEAIVNSSNDSLDLSKGAVSKAIREACGDDIIVQCSKQKGNMEDTGIAMTGVPAGSLACGNIIHISADRFKRDWQKGVLKVLQTADTNHLQSVALPALGTGGRSANPKQLAQSMQQAVVEFADEARYVKEVRIIIFQSELLSHYCTAFDSSSVPAGAEAAAQSDEEVQETENKPWKDVEVYVYSDKKDAIEEAFDKVSTHIKQSTTSKEEKDTLISKFDKQQRSEVLLLQTKHDVEIQLDEKASRVKITGFEIDVARASSDLKTIMFKASKERHLAAGMPPVRWQYEVGSNKYKDFDPEQTLEIEAAFKKKEKSVIFSDKKKNPYKIVFKEKLEYSLNDRDSNPVKVRRRDILHEKSQELPLPSHWAPMKKDEKVKVVDLDPSSNEYKRVAQHFGGVSDLGGVLGNVPHLRSQAGTLKIQRIQNPSLFQAFKIKKSELEKFNTNTKENEQRLWHGTDSNNIQGIITNGFNRSYCGRNGTAYGDGVYFAVNSSTSMGYASGRQMFQARVLVGESTPGRRGMRTPPQKPGSDRLYDSLSGPGMFIIFHDSQAYPEYLLTF